jgi:gliding motility-associated lipoprotein GldH
MRPAFLILLAFAAACGNTYHYDAERELPDGVWPYADSVAFDFTIADTAARYNLYLDLAHADTFSKQNVYLRFHTVFPDGKRASSVLSFDLFNSLGAANGACRGGRCTLQSVLQQNARFAQAGDYRLVVEQWMRQDSLRGIYRVGMMVEKNPGAGR